MKAFWSKIVIFLSSETRYQNKCDIIRCTTLQCFMKLLYFFLFCYYILPIGSQWLLLLLLLFVFSIISSTSQTKNWEMILSDFPKSSIFVSVDNLVVMFFQFSNEAGISSWFGKNLINRNNILLFQK